MNEVCEACTTRHPVGFIHTQDENGKKVETFRVCGSCYRAPLSTLVPHMRRMRLIAFHRVRLASPSLKPLFYSRTND